MPFDLDSALDTLSSYLPQPVVNVLWFIFDTLWSLVPASSQWNTQNALPLLFSLFAIYFTLASIYRTASFAFRAFFFFVKWGALIAAVAFVLSWVSGDGAGEVSAGAGRARRPGLGKRPKPWDTFDKHAEYNKQWRAQASYEARVHRAEAEEGRRLVQGVMDYVWSTAQRFVVDRAFTSSTQPQSDTSRDDRTRSKGKGTRSR